MSTIKANTVTAADLNTDLTLTGNGTGKVNLEAGTKLNGTALGTAATLNAGSGSGDLLRTDGSAASLTGIPAYYELITSGTLSAASSLAIEGSDYINDDYIRYVLEYEETGNVSAGIQITFREEATGTYFSANYADALTGVSGAGNAMTASAYNTTTIYPSFTFFHPNHTSGTKFEFHSFRASDCYSSVFWHAGYPEDYYSKTAVAYGYGTLRDNAVIDGMKWTAVTGTFTGRYWWYGLKGA